VRIIKEKFLKDAAARHPKAASQLIAWRKVVLAATWRNLVEVRGTFPSADPVRVESDHNVYVFNICGNDFRLVAAIHFNTQCIFTLRFLTHAEYSKNKWKLDL
jgi:mRNA interferase HigB